MFDEPPPPPPNYYEQEDKQQDLLSNFIEFIEKKECSLKFNVQDGKIHLIEIINRRKYQKDDYIKIDNKPYNYDKYLKKEHRVQWYTLVKTIKKLLKEFFFEGIKFKTYHYCSAETGLLLTSLYEKTGDFDPYFIFYYNSVCELIKQKKILLQIMEKTKSLNPVIDKLYFNYPEKIKVKKYITNWLKDSEQKREEVYEDHYTVPKEHNPHELFMEDCDIFVESKMVYE